MPGNVSRVLVMVGSITVGLFVGMYVEAKTTTPTIRVAEKMVIECNAELEKLSNTCKEICETTFQHVRNERDEVTKQLQLLRGWCIK